MKYYSDNDFKDILFKLELSKDDLTFLNWHRDRFDAGLNDLFYACAQQGMNDIIVALVNGRVLDVNHCLLDGEGGKDFPLNFAISHRMFDMADKLLDLGADVSLVDGEYRSARERIIKGYDAPIGLLKKAISTSGWGTPSEKEEFTNLNTLLSLYPDDKELEASFLSSLSLLISSGEKVNEYDQATKMTPLAMAARRDCAGGAVLQVLIDAGANVNERVGGRTTPLTIAIRNELTSNIEKLIKAGAVITELDQKLTEQDYPEMLAYAKNVYLSKQLTEKVNAVTPASSKSNDLKRLSL